MFSFAITDVLFCEWKLWGWEWLSPCSAYDGQNFAAGVYTLSSRLCLCSVSWCISSMNSRIHEYLFNLTDFNPVFSGKMNSVTNITHASKENSNSFIHLSEKKDLFSVKSKIYWKWISWLRVCKVSNEQPGLGGLHWPLHEAVGAIIKREIFSHKTRNIFSFCFCPFISQTNLTITPSRFGKLNF